MSWSIKQIVREEMANAGRPPSEVACTFLADYCYVRFGEVGGSDISIGITRQAELSGPDAVREVVRAAIASGFPTAGPGILADGRTAREVACDERWTAVQYRPAHCRRCGHDRGCMCPRSYEA